MTRGILTGSCRKYPTSSMGVVLLLYCSSPGAQCSKGSLQAFKQYVRSSLNLLESNPLLRGGLSLLYFKVGPLFTYFYHGVLVRPGVFRLHQSVGPAQSVGSGEACVRLVFLGDGLSICCPVSGQSEWLCHSVGRSAVIFSLYVRIAATPPSLCGF